LSIFVNFLSISDRQLKKRGKNALSSIKKGKNSGELKKNAK